MGVHQGAIVIPAALPITCYQVVLQRCKVVPPVSRSQPSNSRGKADAAITKVIRGVEVVDKPDAQGPPLVLVGDGTGHRAAEQGGGQLGGACSQGVEGQLDAAAAGEGEDQVAGAAVWGLLAQHTEEGVNLGLGALDAASASVRDGSAVGAQLLGKTVCVLDGDGGVEHPEHIHSLVKVKALPGVANDLGPRNVSLVALAVDAPDHHLTLDVGLGLEPSGEEVLKGIPSTIQGLEHRGGPGV
mmetsp:Transcript_12535/g.27032  ORF Transcript_12535/g.27032 Transcript_12535/m.27032 type:complete len:242 (-) Transcript_12535:640-1365(-)